MSWPWSPKTPDPALEMLVEMLGQQAQLNADLTALVVSLSRENEAIKAAVDRVYAEVRLAHNRVERVDGRMERAEIRMLAIDPLYPETQLQLPDGVLAASRDALDAGLPKRLASEEAAP